MLKSDRFHEFDKNYKICWLPPSTPRVPDTTPIVSLFLFAEILESVCLGGCVCVLLKTQMQHAWLRKKSSLLFIDPTVNCVRNAGRRKAARCCFLCGWEVQPCYTVQLTVEHASTFPTGPGLVQSAKCIKPGPTQWNKKIIFYFLIVFYSKN